MTRIRACQTNPLIATMGLMTTLMPQPRRVLFVVLNNVHVLDLAGPLQVFDEARHLGANYSLHHVGLTNSVRSAQGLQLCQLEPLPAPQASDLIVVAGTSVRERLGRRHPDERPLHLWLRSALACGAQIASVCSGALVLLEAGLLTGRRFTTHWSLFEPLRQSHPNAKLEQAALFVSDGQITTSAGIASGIDMALWLLERDHGPLLAARVAREMVVYLRRSGQQAQRSIYLEYRTHLHPGVHRVQDHLVQHAGQKLKLSDLAGLANLSSRGLTHAFKQATGLTPLKYQTRLRLELAQQLFNDPHLTLEAIAARCGFEDPRQLRRLWRERFGIAPSQARNHSQQQKFGAQEAR